MSEDIEAELRDFWRRFTEGAEPMTRVLENPAQMDDRRALVQSCYDEYRAAWESDALVLIESIVSRLPDPIEDQEPSPAIEDPGPLFVLYNAEDECYWAGAGLEGVPLWDAAVYTPAQLLPILAGFDLDEDDEGWESVELTPLLRLRQAIADAEADRWTDDEGHYADDSFLDDDGQPIGRFLMVEHATIDSRFWLTPFDSPEDAVDYHVNQEYASEWMIDQIIDLHTGEVWDTAGRVQVGVKKLHGSRPALPKGA